MSIKSVNTVFNIADLFKQVHGYVPAHLDTLYPDTISDQPLANLPAITKKTVTKLGMPIFGSADMMGREVFCPITIVSNGEKFKFPYAVASISRSKIIVSTPMTEIGGSVHEVISNDDYQITIKGFLIGQYEQFPDEELINLRRLFDRNEAVRLQSALTDLFLHDNDHVILTRLDIPAKPKVIGVRDFELQMVSDNIFTLYVNE